MLIVIHQTLKKHL